MDWKKVIHELLHEAGFTQVIIAEKVGTNQSTISALYRGTQRDASYTIGHRLLKLHEKIPKKKRHA